MKTTEEKLRDLYLAVQTRPRPEDVAETILDILGPSLNAREKQLLESTAKFSLRKSLWGYSSMAADFARPTTKIENQLKVAAILFKVEVPNAFDCLDPEKVETFLKSICGSIGKVYGRNEFSMDRLTKDQRRQMGLFKNAHWYNKRWRLLARMEKKIQSLIFNRRKYLFTRVGKSGLAVEIPFEDFAADVNTACFVAYMSARMSIRSVFTNTSQEQAYDKLAEALFERAVNAGTIRYDVAAYLMPDEKIISKLTQEQKGKMLGTWWKLLEDMADMFTELSATTGFDPQTMIVSRGNDSSTWNQVAGGWNKAREQWISLVYAMGLDSILDEVCPGKIMRLMAADVARWHNNLHPDTKVFGELPFPWEVVQGKFSCTRRLIERVCEKNNVPKGNWIAPKGNRNAIESSPTPELVHGVAVWSPYLAKRLRDMKAFSGKPLSI